jgi:hypothetical protein
MKIIKKKVFKRPKENYDNNQEKILQSQKEFVNKNKDKVEGRKKQYRRIIKKN